MRWIQRVEHATLAELEIPDKRWDDLDIMLSQVVVAIINGPLRKEIVLYQAAQALQGRPMQGRAALWHVYQKFKLSAGAALAVDYQTLMALKFEGDLKGFMHS